MMTEDEKLPMVGTSLRCKKIYKTIAKLMKADYNCSDNWRIWDRKGAGRESNS